MPDAPIAPRRRGRTAAPLPEVADPVSAEYVRGCYEYAKRQPDERGLRAFIAEVRSLFDMTHPVSIPKEYRAITKEVRTPFLRDVALRVTASLTKEPSVTTVVPRDDTTDGKRAAEIGSKWTMAQFSQMDALGHEDVVYQSALALVRDSESVIKQVHRPDAWANFPERERSEDGGYAEEARSYNHRVDRHRKGGVFAPYAARVVDRLQMVFGDGEYGDEWAIEYGEYPLPYLLEKYYPDQNGRPVTPAGMLGGRPTPETGGYGDKALKLEFHNSRQWAVVINGAMAPGYPKPNPYESLLPYHRAVSYPALYSLKYLVPALDALLTMKLNWAYLSSFPVVVMEALRGVQGMLDGLPAPDTGEPPSNMTWRPGRVYFPPSGYTMRFLEPPGTGRDVDALISEMREMIDVAGVPSVFRGVGGARQAGYAVNQLYAAAQLSFRKLAEALERQQESRARFLWHTVAHTIPADIGPVYVLGGGSDERRWVGLKASGEVQVDVAPVDRLGLAKTKFRPVMPTDEQAEAMIAMQLLNAPKQVLPHEYILEHYLQIEDPSAKLDQIWVEQELNAEPLRARMVTAAMRKARLPVPTPGGSPPPELPSPNGSGAPPGPNDVTNAGEPTIPLLTQAPGSGQTVTPAGVPGPAPIGLGGRPAGAFPGQPGG